MSDFLLNAKKFAASKHAHQKYGDEFPYVVHLQAVESVLLRFGEVDPERRSVAWLHDVLEDTDASYEDIVLYFGRRVADGVSAVTEPKGGNRKWRHEQTYPRIRQNVDAIIVKLADRIANVEFGGKLVKMYAKEYVTFKSALYNIDEILNDNDRKIVKDMWYHLDSLMINI